MVNQRIIFLGQEYTNESEISKVAIVKGVSLLLSELILDYEKEAAQMEGQISINCDMPPEKAIQISSPDPDFKARVDMAFGI